MPKPIAETVGTSFEDLRELHALILKRGKAEVANGSMFHSSIVHLLGAYEVGAVGVMPVAQRDEVAEAARRILVSVCAEEGRAGPPGVVAAAALLLEAKLDELVRAKRDED